jgi:uncharacterized repeat protein (TIGR01451 family)
VAPAEPGPGDPVTVTVAVRNDGGRPIAGVRLTHEPGPGATVRGASGPGGACAVVPRRATCPLGDVAAGATVAVRVRLLTDREPPGPALVQRITVSGAGRSELVARTVSTLVDRPPAGARLLDLPGPTVRLIAFVGFVLAARSRS